MTTESPTTYDQLDHAIRRHVTEETEGDLAVAWVLTVGLVARNDDGDIYLEHAANQPTYVTSGLLTTAHHVYNHAIGTSTDDDEDND